MTLDTVAVDDPPVALFKAGERKYMLDLIDEGHLYLNTLGHFKALDDGSSRSDPDEATAFAWQAREYTLDVDVSVSFGLVDYVDRNDYQGVMGPFRKFSKYANQSEFRIMLTPGTGSPLSLRLGSLRDIAVFAEGTGRFLVTPKDV